MSFSLEGDASRSIVPSRHTQGDLLSYFLAPGTSNLTYDEVLARVIGDNYRLLRKRQDQLATALQIFNSQRTWYLDELDSLSKQLDSTGSLSMREDLEARMSLVWATVMKIEDSISWYENQRDMSPQGS